MSVFFPNELITLLILILEILMILAIGLILINKKRLKWVGWIVPILAVGSTHFFLQESPSGFRMIALILVLLLSMKILVAQYRPEKFNFQQYLLFSLAWVGMNPSVFFNKVHANNYKKLLYKGVLFLIVGFALLTVLNFLSFEINNFWKIYALGLPLLVSLSWVLHFGLLNINAALLKIYDFPAYPLFDKPLLSQSLQEFWGKRWNLAFTEMTSTVGFKPLLKIINRRAALFISFMFSGILHEIALSLSVQKGFGLPMLYFLLQALMIALEKPLFKNKKPGHVWVIVWLLLPIPLIFHVYVMREVFLPLIVQ